MDEAPSIELLPKAGRRFRAGAPWVFGNELKVDAGAKAITAGTMVRLRDEHGRPLGIGSFNRHSLISFRAFGGPDQLVIDRDFLRQRLVAALTLRRQFGLEHHCRLVHAEADGLPGVVIDRFGDILVMQANTAGAERLTPALVELLVELFRPVAIVLRNDAAQRQLEGLEPTVSLAYGAMPDSAITEEGGVNFPIDPLGGQKTGFFHDLRPARDIVARLAAGAQVLDVYCHTGAFGIRAAVAGAAAVTLIDASKPTLALATAAAVRNGVAASCTTVASDAFDFLSQETRRFDLVITDPPSFVKSKKDLAAGLRGYRKLANLAARRVVSGGYWFVASCSHHVQPEAFAAEIAAGLQTARRAAQVVVTGGAGPDHPTHPHLPETAYIKWQLLRLT